MPLNILLIANQPRLQQVVSAAASATAASLSLASNLDEGIEALFSRAPSLILLQSRLSGLSAEIVIRHVKAELGDNSATIVLLAEAVDTGAAAYADTVLDCTTSNDDLTAAVVKLISASKTEAAARKPASPAVFQEPASILPSQDGLFVPGLMVERVGEPASPPAGEVQSEPSGDEPSPARAKVSIVIEEESVPATPATSATPAPRSFNDELDTLMGPEVEPSSPAASDSAAQFVGPTVEEMLTRTSLPSRKKHSFIPLLVIVIAVIVGATAYLASTPTGPATGKVQDATGKAAATKAVIPSTAPPNSAPPAPAGAATTVRPVVPPAAEPNRLPDFIPRESLAKDYGISNPGWEKYVTSHFEFRLYREKDRVKALQVLDRSGKGIPRAFFSKVIQQMAGVRDYRLETKEKKGGYLVKKGTLNPTTRVILYKTHSDTLLQAFVIYFN